MFAEAFPRLAVRLRSTFPDASISLSHGSSGLRVSFPTFPAWEVEVTGQECYENYQIIQSHLTLRYDCLQSISDNDFYHFLAAENLGLRGVTLLADREGVRRTVRLRSSFIGQKGRTRDEAENIAIDVLSLLRYARLLEDRITRSVAGLDFSFEMYHSQYHSKSQGRTRYINYARSIFQGSCDRVFGQVVSMLRQDYKYAVQTLQPAQSHFVTISPKEATDKKLPNREMLMRIPEEIPMLILHTDIADLRWPPARVYELVSRLNWMTDTGHFEVSADGKKVSFSAWKHLTNDMRYYCFDQLINAVIAGDRLLTLELATLGHNDMNDLAAHLTAKATYRRAA